MKTLKDGAGNSVSNTDFLTDGFRIIKIVWIEYEERRVHLIDPHDHRKWSLTFAEFTDSDWRVQAP